MGLRNPIPFQGFTVPVFSGLFYCACISTVGSIEFPVGSKGVNSPKEAIGKNSKKSTAHPLHLSQVSAFSLKC